MLTQLTVENFALLKHVSLSFDPRFNVLTGETGAGKSIIVDAVKLVLGDRANTSDIRYGEEEAQVEAVFEAPEGHASLKLTKELGIDTDNDILVFSRQVRANGKNICRINRQIVTLKQFKTICSLLISIYGQHEYDELADPAVRLAMLDDLGDAAFQSLRSEAFAAYQKARQSGGALKKAVRAAKSAKQEAETLRQQIDEVAVHKIKRGEEESLTRRFNQASHAQEIYDAVHTTSARLYDGTGNVYDGLTKCLNQLNHVQRYDNKLMTFADRLVELQLAVEELARDVDSYGDTLDIDPELLGSMDERMALFNNLQKRYHCSMDELLDQLESWRNRLDEIVDLDAEIHALSAAYHADKAAYDEISRVLHEKRMILAEGFTQKLIKELADMAMNEVRFEVQFESFAGDATGQDVVTFMISPNPGIPMRPLDAIASGGEMSRIMLAVKSILSGTTGVDTLIFDEIDTGIGGVVLTTVADKLENLSRHEQVICVTHAPVIAARGDHNFFIHKEVDAGTTKTFVESLNDEASVIREVARMNGGTEPWQLETAAKMREKKKR